MSPQIWDCWATSLLYFCLVESGARTTGMPKLPNPRGGLMQTKEWRIRLPLWFTRQPRAPEALRAQLRQDRKLQQVVERLSSPGIWGCTSSRTPEWRVTMEQQQGEILFTPLSSLCFNGNLWFGLSFLLIKWKLLSCQIKLSKVYCTW